MKSGEKFTVVVCSFLTYHSQLIIKLMLHKCAERLTDLPLSFLFADSLALTHGVKPDGRFKLVKEFIDLDHFAEVVQFGQMN